MRLINEENLQNCGSSGHPNQQRIDRKINNTVFNGGKLKISLIFHFSFYHFLSALRQLLEKNHKQIDIQQPIQYSTTGTIDDK